MHDRNGRVIEVGDLVAVQGRVRAFGDDEVALATLAGGALVRVEAVDVEVVEKGGAHQANAAAAADGGAVAPVGDDQAAATTSPAPRGKGQKKAGGRKK